MKVANNAARSDLSVDELKERRDLIADLANVLVSLRLVVRPYSERAQAAFIASNRTMLFDGADVQAVKTAIEKLRADVGIAPAASDSWTGDDD